MPNAKLDEYIRSLDYEPRRLLAVEADGSTSTLLGNDRKDVSNGVIICTKTKHTLRKNLDEVAILSPTAGAIFPGALILADVDMMEGKPTAVALARRPAILSIDLPGLTNKASGPVQPENSAVLEFKNAKLEEWSKNAVSQGYQNAARSILQITKSFSSQQVALDLFW